MDLTPGIKLSTLIKVDRNSKEIPFQRTVEFPEILRDKYGVYQGVVSLSGERIESPMTAFLLDLVKWGYENLEGYSRFKDGRKGLPPEPTSLPYELRPDTSRTMSVWFTPPRKSEAESTKVIGTRRRSTSKTPVRVIPETHFYLPTLSTGPRGYRSAGSGTTPADACFIAAIQQGLSLRNCDNGLSNLHVDDTAERVSFLKGRMSAPDFPLVTVDSGWKNNASTSQSHRGINDFDREMTFSATPTAEQMEVLVEWLSLDKCPGWTGIHTRTKSPTEYRFSTTWDSSD